MSQATADNAEHLPPIRSFLPRNTNEMPAASTSNHNPQESKNFLTNLEEQSSFAHNILTTDNHATFLVENPANQAGCNDPSTISNSRHHSSRRKRIPIKSEPRPTHHPRTLKEKDQDAVRDIIQAEEGSSDKHPSIRIFPEWQNESKENVIEVVMVDTQGKLHPYLIENAGNSPLLHMGRLHDPHALYFSLTNGDFGNGWKSFQIAIVKSKQEGLITKQLIRKQQLEKSMFRFKRFYRFADGDYCPEEESIAYTRIMTEKYGNLTVQYVNPLYGPMGGGHLLDVVCTGCTLADKKKLTFEICAEERGWKHPIINFNSTAGTIRFPMPPCPLVEAEGVVVKIMVYYQAQPIYEAPYVYHASLDVVLRNYGIHTPLPAEASHSTSAEVDEDSTTTPRSSSRTSSRASNKRQRTSSQNE